MPGDIVLSASVRSNLLSLQTTAELLGRTQTRLSTGKKVNSALDNATNFFTAGSLMARSKDLGGLLDNVASAMKVLEAADNGVTAITRLVENAQAVARQALQANPTTARFAGSVTGLSGTSSFSVTNAKTITISDGTTTATVTSGGTVTAQQIINAVNTTANLNVKASLTSDGRLLLEATSTNTIVIAGDASAAEKLQFGLADGTTAAGVLSTTRSSFASQYNELRNQIDKLAQDASFNGINLLNGGGLKVTFNEQNTSSLTIAGVFFNSGSRTAGADNVFNTGDDVVAGLGINASAATFQTDKDINDALGNLTGSLNLLRAQSAAFGTNLAVVQTRQDFIKTLINTLRTGADNLTLADTNEEGANLLALNTRQQLSQTALSLASQASQAVLRLFG